MLAFRKHINAPTKGSAAETDSPNRDVSANSPAPVKKYIASFKGYTDENSQALATKKCFVAFCVGERYHAEGKLDAIVRLIYRHFRFSIALIADEDDVDGAWMQRYISTLEEGLPNSRIYNWWLWVNHPSFSKHQARVERAYNTDPEYKEAFDDYVSERTEKHDKNDPDAMDKNHKYTMTELTIIEMLLTSPDEADHFDCAAYPKKAHKLFLLTFKKCAPQREIEWLEIKFDKNNKSKKQIASADGNRTRKNINSGLGAKNDHQDDFQDSITMQYALNISDTDISLNRVLTFSSKPSEQKQHKSFKLHDVPFDKDDLKNAICRRNIESVRCILRDRITYIEDGDPIFIEKGETTTFGLNGGYFNDGTGTALLWALCDSKSPRLPVSYEIIELLLAQRDEHGELVIDVNYHHRGNPSLLDLIIDPITEFAPGSRVKILQAILDLRCADMSFAFDLRKNAERVEKALWKAVMTNDLDFLKMLLALNVSNVNEIINGRTVLDFAMKKRSPIYKYNPLMIDTIKNCGGLTGSELGVPALDATIEPELSICDYYQAIYHDAITPGFQLFISSGQWVNTLPGQICLNKFSIESEVMMRDDFKTGNILDASSFRLEG